MYILSVGDISYTNWGITNDVLEPSDDTSKKCIQTCLDYNDADCNGKWKTEDCTSTLSYICQAPCKKKRPNILILTMSFAKRS